MDKKEILDILDNAKDERGAVPMRLVRQAFDKLVQPEESTEKRTETHACDSISRQAAVELVMEYCPDDDGAVQCDGDIRELLDEFENLPPAQPERKIYSNMTAEDFEEWLRRNGICHPNIHEDISCSVVPLLIDDAINEVLSAQPERKMGHWIRVAGMNERCSACNKYFPLSYFTGRPFDINYCPNCGADMRGEKDEHID